MDFEIQFLDQLQNMRTPFFDKFWVMITYLGDGGILLIICAVLLMFFKSTRKVGIMCLLALLIGAIITNGFLKNVLQRPRPFEGTFMQLLIDEPGDYSFPSGHTTAAFAMAFTVLKTKLSIKKIPLGLIGLFIASLIAFSRLYLYVHYPSDILVAILIGYIASSITCRVMD